MSWVESNRSAAVIVAVSCAVPALLFLYLLLNLWLVRGAYQEEIDSIRPRIARYMGVMQVEEQLLDSAQSIESAMLDIFFPRDEDAAAVSAALQKNVRSLMADAGLEVTDSRVIPPRQHGEFDVIGLTVTVTGGIDALDAALQEVADYTPLLLVRSIKIEPRRISRIRRAKPQQVLSVRIEFMVLRASQ